MNIAETARNLYLKEGFNCSESILMALRRSGRDIPDSLLAAASGLRKGLGGSGCICGALLASILYISYFYGKTDKEKAEKLTAELHNKFKDKFKSTCCRVLTRKHDFNSPERKAFCAGLVEFMIKEVKTWKLLPSL